MTFYHMSESLNLGDALTPDYKNTMELALPFVQALEQSVDCFYAMVLNGKYLRTVLRKFDLWEWSNYAKWSVEGAFEFIRKTEFPNCCSRLKCNYFHDNLENIKALFAYDWGNEPEEVQNQIHLYEIDLADERPERRDMRIFDQAYDAMNKNDDVQTVLDCARKYFSGMQSEAPVWEILSDKPAKAVADITFCLKD